MLLVALSQAMRQCHRPCGSVIGHAAVAGRSSAEPGNTCLAWRAGWQRVCLSGGRLAAGLAASAMAVPMADLEAAATAFRFRDSSLIS